MKNTRKYSSDHSCHSIPCHSFLLPHVLSPNCEELLEDTRGESQSHSTEYIKGNTWVAWEVTRNFPHPPLRYIVASTSLLVNLWLFGAHLLRATPFVSELFSAPMTGCEYIWRLFSWNDPFAGGKLFWNLNSNDYKQMGKEMKTLLRWLLKDLSPYFMLLDFKICKLQRIYSFNLPLRLLFPCPERCSISGYKVFPIIHLQDHPTDLWTTTQDVHVVIASRFCKTRNFRN